MKKALAYLFIVMFVIAAAVGTRSLMSAWRAGSPIGGSKDAHGCLVGAGYSWCEEKNTCIRQWETYCTAATPKKVTYACADAKTIQATFYPTDDRFVDLVLSDGRSMSVPHARSGSGARYANTDETFVFWNKGDSAFITEGASSTETFSKCLLQEIKPVDYKNSTYIIDGTPVTLKDGSASTPAAPGSAAKTETRVFGNEVKTDLNNDGVEDVAFMLTQSTGGSGTFYYAVAAISGTTTGSHGFFLGDRIAPQATTLGRNKTVQFNFATRREDEPMTATPTVGTTVYLIYDQKTNAFKNLQD